jgi:hypothetical protein
VRPEEIAPDLVTVRAKAMVSVWNRREADLVSDWIDWCAGQGRTVTRPIIPTDEGSTIRGDAFDEGRSLLVEAKGSSERKHVRMAIGQLLDYSSLLDHDHTRAILVPDPIPSSLEELALSLGIGVIHRSGDSFEEHLPRRRRSSGSRRRC